MDELHAESVPGGRVGSVPGMKMPELKTASRTGIRAQLDMKKLSISSEFPVDR
jgi:hypothetical protein